MKQANFWLIRRASWLLLVSLIAIVAGMLPARSEPCALPTKSELGALDPSPDPSWTLQEQWVWKQTLLGKIADFNQLYCEQEPLDPSAEDEAWQNPAKANQSRQLSERFLLDVLGKKRFAEAVPPRGLRIVGALFLTPINLSGVDFERAVWLDKSRFRGPIWLRQAQFGGTLSFDGSTFEAVLNMDSLEVGQSLFLRDKATFKGNVILRSAKVGSNLETDGSTFEAVLNMDSLEVGQSLFLRGGATFKGDVSLIGAKVGGDIELGGATFHQTVDTSGTVVEGELRLGTSQQDRSHWEPTAGLVLRNTSVGALQDRIDTLPDGTRLDAWPSQNLQLDGFVYKRLGGLGGEKDSEMMDRPVSWYQDWLRRDTSFSPQPYRQLAGVFREAGADTKANEILYALREREREEAWQRGEYGQWAGLSMLWATVGYGIGTGYFRALRWAGAFTLVGTIVLWSGSAGTTGKSALWAGPNRQGFVWCTLASFDEILPVIELDARHIAFINERLAGWRRSYFYLHRIVAFVLGSFIIAGLAGLTQGV